MIILAAGIKSVSDATENHLRKVMKNRPWKDWHWVEKAMWIALAIALVAAMSWYMPI